MSYLGFVGIMTDHCAKFAKPRVLEIGVDRGQTTLPLLSNLLGLKREFQYVGVDIRADLCFYNQLDQMRGIHLVEKSSPKQTNARYLINNSLTTLPELVKDGWKFDLILIDGDHNYGTVKKELEYLEQLSHSMTLVICDDYSGRHADTDTFYSDYETHQDIELFQEVAAPEGRAGVNQAIDDFVASTENWRLIPASHEPVLLVPQGIVDSPNPNGPGVLLDLQPRGSDYLLLI